MKPGAWGDPKSILHKRERRKCIASQKNVPENHERKIGKKRKPKVRIRTSKKNNVKNPRNPSRHISFPDRPSTESDLPMVSPWPRGHYKGEILPVDGTRPGKRLQKANWKDPPFFMGKSTISTGSFSSSQTVDITRLGTLRSSIPEAMEGEKAIRTSQAKRWIFKPWQFPQGIK